MDHFDKDEVEAALVEEYDLDKDAASILASRYVLKGTFVPGMTAGEVAEDIYNDDSFWDNDWRDTQL